MRAFETHEYEMRYTPICRYQLQYLIKAANRIRIL